jgi:hypothetical protein
LLKIENRKPFDGNQLEKMETKRHLSKDVLIYKQTLNGCSEESEAMQIERSTNEEDLFPWEKTNRANA